LNAVSRPVQQPASGFAGVSRLARRLVRGREADAAWVRPALISILTLTAALYVWGLDRNGYANAYYSAAVQAATQSWKAFFFGSLDAGNFITVDKPPAALWLMALSARIFGLSAWSLLLPEALAGVLTVAVLFHAVRSSFGAVAALVAAAVMALTPVAVVMFRFNNPDALLTLLLVASAWALLRAQSSGRTGWLLLSAAFVGLAFNTKYLQAFMVLPALLVTYLLLGPGGLRRRFLQLLGAFAVLVVASGWWMAIVTAIPASARPFIGGSTNNSVLDLVLGYDGFGRILGAQRPGGGGGAFPAGGLGGFGGQPGWLRLFNEQVGGEISWLLPLAAVGLVAGLWALRARPRADVARAAYMLWGLWLLVHAVVFSFASGIFHAYYTVAMAPAVAALAGGGLVELWRLRSRSLVGGVALGFALVVSAWWGSRLLARTPGFAPGLSALELGAAVAATLVLLALGLLRRAPAGGFGRRLPLVAVVVGTLAVLLGPAAYAVDTVAQSRSGPDPAPGPMASAGGAGPAVLGRGGGVRLAGPGGFPAGAVSPASGPGGAPRPALGPGLGARGRGGAAADPALISYLKQHQGGATWIVAVVSANESASIQLSSGRPVMAMGGFMGSDPALSVDQLEALVSSGKLRYVLLGSQDRDGGGGGPAGDSAGQVRTSWVTQNCRQVDYAGSSSSGQAGTLYDCFPAAPGGR
jgi:4-amino-4-deoxy-L-arabinose transferase-like glycosyltransferase